MRALTTATAILALLALTGADPDCESLIKPLDMKEPPVMGNWWFLAGFADHRLFANLLNMLNSSYLSLTATEQSDTFHMHLKEMVKGRCEFVTFNVTLKDNRLHMAKNIYGMPMTIVVKNLPSSDPDYVVSKFKYEVGGLTIRALYLFGRSATISDTMLQAFQKQAECMGFSGPPHFTYDGVTELCDHDQHKAKCEPLKKTQEVTDVTPYMGKWILVMEYADHMLFIDVLKKTTSYWMLWTPTDQKDTFTINQGSMMNGTCQFLNSNANLYNIYGSSFLQSAVEYEGHEVTTKGFFLSSGADTLVMHFESQMAGQHINSLCLLSRTGKASAADVEAYLQQAECWGFTRDASFTYDGVTELCEKS
ncbi:saxitoxin and tetrodotoxin-binding protein 1-like [Engraulis encrasicolus]|uniref:saxitoxin and tetrodotoxin-binding protein 1-like n=1 Tax=Engraulis encrasicolus TaxID=184585 RepID=UPI002FD104DE